MTTRLGFGGSGLMGGISERESLKLLETAFDAGIRHFDIAPAYGHGQAERCLGKFLQGKRDQVTVATKYGILPPAQAGLMKMARSVVRPAVAKLPAVRQRVAQAAAGMRSKAKFSAEEAGKSLEQSLQQLGVERIDLWLLHEAIAEDLDDSDLLPFLRHAQQRGLIGAYGVGAERERAHDVWERHRDYCKVLQFEWSVLEGKEASFPGAFVIHYRAISGAFDMLRRFLQPDSDRCREWSNVVDLDLSDAKLLAESCCRRLWRRTRRAGVVFFSSSTAHPCERTGGGRDGRTRERSASSGIGRGESRRIGAA